MTTTFQSYSGIFNVKDYGAVGNGITDDSSAFQAMFDAVETASLHARILFGPHRYYIRSALTLPSVTGNGVIEIDGGGAELYTDQAITILSRIPADQTEAGVFIECATFDIHGVKFTGTSGSQRGLALGSTYAASVRNCHFITLNIGCAVLNGLAARLESLVCVNCRTYGIVLESGVGTYSGLGWSGASVTNSASNVSIIEGCRVYGISTQDAAYLVSASDLVTLRNCISEGNGANFDVRFDGESSTTVKKFTIEGLHCEAPDSVVNIRAAMPDGGVVINNMARGYPAALLDASGSTGASYFRFNNLVYLGNMPAGGSGARWFYHADGDGYGGTEDASSHSSGFTFEFTGLPLGSSASGLITTANWENGALPFNLVFHGDQGSNAGREFYSTNPYTINSVYAWDRLRVPAVSKFSLTGANPPAQLIYVSDEAGGAVLAFSDGSNWRRVTDRAVVS